MSEPMSERFDGPVDQAIDRAAGALDVASRIALACHVNPDADALGSMLGLAGYLRARGKDVVCSWGNQPMNRPRWLTLLDGEAPLVEPRDFPADPPLMVALDTASPDRLGMLWANAERATEVIVID